MKNQFEENFLIVYRKAEKLGFKDYIIGVHNGICVTWVDVKTMIDFKIRIPKKQRENIEANLKIFFQSQKNKEIYLKAIKELKKQEKEK